MPWPTTSPLPRSLLRFGHLCAVPIAGFAVFALFAIISGCVRTAVKEPVAGGLTAAELAPAKHHSRSPGDGLAPKKPNRWFYLERAYPSGRIPREHWKRAQREARRIKEKAGRTKASWTPRGPTNVGGRVTAMAVDPTDSDTVYAAAAEGGVLRSRDGGQTWTPLFDEMPSLSVGAISLDPSNPHVIYVGTGEVNPGGGSVAYGGAGLFRSIDQGETWESMGLENSGSIGRIRVDPSDGDRIFVAVMGHLWETGTDRGVYRTTDGCRSWEKVLFVDEETGCVDLIQRPDNPDVLLAAMWERLRQPESYDYGGPGCAIYRTIDGGDNWTAAAGGLPVPSDAGGRIGLSLCASQPDVMHAVYCDNIGYFDGLYRSEDGGVTWSQTDDRDLSDVFASYGWWFGNVRTHPVDPDIIYVLGFSFWRSTNGGRRWRDESDNMHVDHHGLDFGSGPDPVIYAGNDGGVYRSTNGGTAWNKLPDLPITQFYRVALDPNIPGALYGGAQDNGTCRTLSGAVDDYDVIYGGDGFQPLVHPLNSDRIWAQYQFGNLSYSDDGGRNWRRATDGVEGRKNWNSPLVQDPTDPERRYFGTHRVYGSTSDTSWTAISDDLTGGPHGGSGGQVNGTLTTIAVSPLDGDVIWAGSDDGHVSVTRDGGDNWTLVSGALPARWVTSVRCDPFDRETAYVTISGFRWTGNLPHVFRTEDLGENWEPIAEGLPEAPANDLIPDPGVQNRYFVATDLGVYETWNGGSNWSALGEGLPNVVVTQLALDEPNRKLVAATYGRGFFEFDVDASLPPETIYRGTVPVLAGDWKTAALPLGPANDDETPPFPMQTTLPGSAMDTLTTTHPLVLYRLLGPGESPLGNVLMLVKDPTGVVLSF